jgi:hypothetical protein
MKMKIENTNQTKTNLLAKELNEHPAGRTVARVEAGRTSGWVLLRFANNDFLTIWVGSAVIGSCPDDPICVMTLHYDKPIPLPEYPESGLGSYGFRGVDGEEHCGMCGKSGHSFWEETACDAAQEELEEQLQYMALLKKQ